VRAQVKKFQNSHPAASADGIARVSFGNGSIGERIAPLVQRATRAHVISQPASR